MRLLDVENGSWIQIIGYSDGKEIERKLRQLGLNPGTCGKVVRQAPFGGPILIEVDGRSIALGRGIANKIEVEEGVPPCG